jgi:hypothetical protein
MMKNAAKFRLEHNTAIFNYPAALVIRSLATTKSNDDILASVPDKFKQWIHIMFKVATKSLPGHKP